MSERLINEEYNYLVTERERDEYKAALEEVGELVKYHSERWGKDYPFKGLQDIWQVVEQTLK